MVWWFLLYICIGFIVSIIDSMVRKSDMLSIAAFIIWPVVLFLLLKLLVDIVYIIYKTKKGW